MIEAKSSISRTEKGTQPFLEARNVWKRFPGVVALKNASISILPGEIHGLVGENGAGKSTLMHILAGVYKADEGEIIIGGEPVEWRDPAHARRSGIGMVFQDTRLVPDLNVTQNVWLGLEMRKWGGLLDFDRMDKATEELTNQFAIPIEIREYVSELNMAQRQIVEIIKAMVSESKLLILDEPTACLSPQEVKQLFGILENIRRTGTSIVFISHRIPEVLKIVDRVTVLKDGEVVGTLDRAVANLELLVKMMVGREVKAIFPERDVRKNDVKPVLTVNGLSSDSFKDISFELRPGEILGLAGIEGNGQREICRALFGLDKNLTGEIRLNGRRVEIRSPRDAIREGIAHASSDRHGESLFESLSVRENASLPSLSLFEYFRFFVSKRREHEGVYKEVIQKLTVRTPSTDTVIRNLSGGNQQKVVFGRWLMTKPSVYLFDEPTKGIDIGSKVESYSLIRQLAQEGSGVIMLSSDMIELIGLTDRLLVVARGRITDEIPSSEATEERVLSAAVCKVDEEGEMETAWSPEETKKSKFMFNRFAFKRVWLSPLILSIFIAALMLITSAKSQYFWSWYNLGSLASQAVPLGLVSLGQFSVLLLGGIDLSVGPLMSVITCVASYLLVQDSSVPYWVGILGCIFVGGAVGIFNAMIVRYFRIPDLIATLASYSILMGVALIVRETPGGLLSYDFVDAMDLPIGAVPLSFVLLVIIFGVGEIVLRRTSLGTALYATGSSEKTAFYTGLPTLRYRVWAYVFCGIMASIAGLFLAVRIGSGDPKSGTNFTILSITAAVVGGTSILGGRGTLTGVFLGTIFLIITQNFLNLLKASAYLQYVVSGVVVFVAVGLYSLEWKELRKKITRAFSSKSTPSPTELSYPPR